jgi:hypothetical protein
VSKAAKFWLIVGLLIGMWPRLRYWRNGFIVRRLAKMLRGPSMVMTDCSAMLYAGADMDQSLKLDP